jgi:hypothetical protein
MLVINIHKTEFELERYYSFVGIDLGYYFKTDGFWSGIYKYVAIGNVYRGHINCDLQYCFNLKTNYEKFSVRYDYF